MTNPSPRRPWLAALLSVAAPGLGHLYVGRPKRALAMVLGGFTVIVFAALASLFLPAGSQTGAMVMVSIALTLAIAWDAARCAREAGADYELRSYNRWWVYALTLVVLALTANPWTLRYLFARSLRPVFVTTDAMAPTLVSGDAVLVQPLADSIFIGDLVAAHVEGREQILRVAGVPGTRVAEQDGHLVIDDITMLEPWVVHAGARTWGPVTLGAGHYLLMSDARDELRSPVPYAIVARNAITGMPVVIFWSRDPQGTLRSDRIGVTPL